MHDTPWALSCPCHSPKPLGALGRHALALHMAAIGQNVQFTARFNLLGHYAKMTGDYCVSRTCFAGNDLLHAASRLVPAPTTCGRGGIGRRAALRSLWGNPWKFESSRPHQMAFQSARIASVFKRSHRWYPTSTPSMGHVDPPNGGAGTAAHQVTRQNRTYPVHPSPAEIQLIDTSRASVARF